MMFIVTSLYSRVEALFENVVALSFEGLENVKADSQPADIYS